ncbi:hypothetical protein E0D97_08530 [Oricola cellulosilytica]|uniref:Holin n=2 Tax=Oricola cellulosilytica TaxID=1429082 RepID=A0A4R0PGL7_9HYPH|nr:hypothetical protein E0D97_08530 [Oricola cellulosilytica]
MNDQKPWYLSKTIWGALVSVSATVAMMAGMPVDAGSQAVLTESILQTISAVAAIVAIVGRVGANSRIG